MKNILKTSFRRLVVYVSISITLVVGLMLGIMGYQHQKYRLLSHYTVDMTNDLPAFLSEIWSSNILPPFEEWQSLHQKDASNFSMFICDSQNNELWRSVSADAEEILREIDSNSVTTNLCLHPDLTLKKGTINLIRLENDAHALLHTIGLSANDNVPDGRLVALKRMSQSTKPIQQLWLRVLAYSITGTLITILIVYLIFKYGFRPFNLLEEELNSIRAGKTQKLSGKYPEDLHNITSAFNELMFQQKENEQRYRRALNDLAHSLKTRVAVSQALLTDIEQGKIDAINQQLLEMDDVIQGQLKRASFGVKGITENSTLIKPVINSLLMMFDKVHMDKGLQVELFISKGQTLPMSKSDIMEVFGNLLENTYRFAQSRIDIFVNNGESGLIVTINNDGPPIEPEIRDKLFQRGVRADEQNPGTGLGLALCDEIIHSYKGAIWFEDPADPSMGVSLKIMLPYS